MSASDAVSSVPYVAIESQELFEVRVAAPLETVEKTDAAGQRCLNGCKKLCQRSCDVISFVAGAAGTVGGLAITTTAAKLVGVSLSPYIGIPIAVLGFVTAKHNYDIIKNWS